MKDPAEIRLDHDAPVLVGHAGDQTVACHAGIVDEDVELAHPVDQCLRLFRVGDVGLDGACACFASDLFRLILARAVAEGDDGSGARELERDRTPDTPRPTRDEGGLPVQRRERVRQREASPRACRSLPASRPRSSSRCGRFA